jgi:hypothetical protein
MNKKISNRLAFDLYVWIRFVLFIVIVVYIFTLLKGFRTGFKNMSPPSLDLIIMMAVLAFVISIIEFLVKPSYFEGVVNYGDISIKSYSPNKKNGLVFLLIIFYRQYLIEYRIDRHSFNNYRILIEKYGFRKSLILQKLENGKLYESKPINISFLGAKKYTDLILSIDRLKEKISLN